MIPQPGTQKGMRTIAANQFNQLWKILSEVTRATALHTPLTKAKPMTMPNLFRVGKCNSVKCPE